MTLPSGLLTTYLGADTHANRPATPNIAAGTVGLYWETDTRSLFAYDLTNAAWTAAGGGGGGGASKLTYPLASLASLSNSQNYGARGTILIAGEAVTVTDLYALMTPVSGGTYKLGIAPFNNATNHITSAPNYTSAITPTSSTLQSLSGALASALTLIPGAFYVVFIVRTDVVGTTAMDMTYSTTAKAAAGFVPQGSPNGLKLDSNAPATTDSWFNESADYSVGPLYTLP